MGTKKKTLSPTQADKDIDARLMKLQPPILRPFEDETNIRTAIKSIAKKNNRE